MKKRPIAFVIAAFAIFAALFSGCSCSGDDTLSFNFNLPTTETLSYKVEYISDYNENTKKNAELDKYFTFEYSVGTYTSEIKAADKSDEKIKHSDILEIKRTDGTAFVKAVYLLTTDFEIDLSVTVNGQEPYFHKEKITTTAYIADFGVSFAPLYAEENAEYTIISIGKETKITLLQSESKRYYNKEEYVTQLTAKTFSGSETTTPEGEETKEQTTKYTFRSAIDNAEFLYAMRGLKIEEKASNSIKVVSSTFETPQPLSITNTALSEKEFTFKYNDEPVTEKIKYASLSFALNKTNTSGIPQYASVQAEDSEHFKNTRFLLEYVKPLITYDKSFTSMGALKFTIDSAVIG